MRTTTLGTIEDDIELPLFVNLKEESESSSFESLSNRIRTDAASLWGGRGVWITAATFVVFATILCICAAHTATEPDTTRQKLLVLGISSVVFVTSITTMMQPSAIPLENYDEYRKTWFGHRMSKEGEWFHIPVALCATYSFVLCYGAIVSLVSPTTHVLSIPAFYGAGLLVFYAWHVAAHTWENSELKRYHMIHHHETYPQDDFFGDRHPGVQQERQDRGGEPHTLWSLMNPANSATSSLAHEGPIIVGMASILLFAKFYLGASTITCLFALLGYAFMASLGGAIHMSFHERGFHLEQYAWYRELRSLHMIHHMHRKNYAMVNVLVDIVFGSLLLSE